MFRSEESPTLFVCVRVYEIKVSDKVHKEINLFPQKKPHYEGLYTARAAAVINFL